MMAEEGQRPSSTLLISIFMPAVCSILHPWPSLPLSISPHILLPFFSPPSLLHPPSPSLYPCSFFHSFLFLLSVKTLPSLSLSLHFAPHILLPFFPPPRLLYPPSPSLYPSSSSLFLLSVKTPPSLSLSLHFAPRIPLPLFSSSPLLSSLSPSTPLAPSVTLLHILTRSLTKTY